MTPRSIAKLKPTAAAYYVSDTVIPGLQLRVAPDNSRSWSVRYTIGRQQRRLTLGDGVLSLANARKLAKDARRQVANGHDPAEQKIERRDAETVASFIDIYIEKYAKPKKKSWRDDARMLRRQVRPNWKHRLMKDITRRDVRVLLDVILDRGAATLANRVHSLLGKFFAFAIEQDVVEHNPVRDLPKPSKERIRERVLTEDEIRIFWSTTATLDPKLTAMWRIRLLTAKRPGEVADMRWSDVDLETGWWTSPAAREKNGLAHRVALSGPILDLLRALPDRAGYVFAEVRGKRQRAVTFALPDFQPKDLRKTGATYLSKHGISDETIDAVLNHKKTGIIKVYNLHRYDAEKKIALDLWARVLTAIVERKDSNVVAFARA